MTIPFCGSKFEFNSSIKLFFKILYDSRNRFSNCSSHNDIDLEELSC